MPNEIRQYRPAFFEGFENETVQFNTTDELKEIPFVKNFSEAPEFYRFSVSSASAGNLTRHNLMAEYREGKEWWVVGILKTTDGLNLPKWEPNVAPKTN